MNRFDLSIKSGWGRKGDSLYTHYAAGERRRNLAVVETKRCRR
jgi:hypothetical protein